MQRHNANGLAVAEFLADHPRDRKGLLSRAWSRIAYYEVAQRTMRGFGGLVTFLVKDADWRQTAAVVDARAHSADRPQPGRRRIADRAAAGDELLRVHARGSPAVRHPRQHDPPVLRHREHRRPDRRSEAGAGRIEEWRDGAAPVRAHTRHPAHPSLPLLRRLPCNSALAPSTSATNRDPQTGAVVPPIHLAATFVQPGAGEWARVRLLAQRQSHAQGVRNRRWPRWKAGTRALAFASGMAATHCATMLLSAGDHVVAGSDIYGGTYRLLHKVLNRSGIDVTLVAPAPIWRGSRRRSRRRRSCCGSKRPAIR